MKRVAITGLGAISPVGLTAPETWAAVVEGRSGIGPLDVPRMELLSTEIAAQVKGFDPKAHFPAKRIVTLDPFSQFAVVAAREALADSGLDPEGDAVRGASTILGVGVGGIVTLDDSFYKIYGEKGTRVHPFTIPRLMPNAAASQVSMHLGSRGMTYAVASACASATHAIGLAYRSIRAGDATIAFAGGTEACITTGTLMGWEALRVLASDTCRPFSRNRSGLVLGEGAAVLLLEEWDHAVARGADIYAEVTGFGANADAGDLTSPDQDNAARAMQLALDDAGLSPADVAYVNAHGTGTLMNDMVESAAIRAVFSGHPLPLVSSVKAVLGHGLGAAGALEAVATVMALKEQRVPPTANCDDPDPELGLDFVTEGARSLAFDNALSNSFAFGGLNAVLAFRRHGAA